MVLTSHWTGHFFYWFGVQQPQWAAVADRIGDAGVELFFALSGFLIGRILIDIVRVGSEWADLRVFMIRRAMRTLPLYFMWLALILCLFPPRQDAVWVAMRFLTMTQNLLSPMPADYYFAVTWSLAIEEWFYLLFGIVLFIGGRFLSGTRALGCCLGLFMLAPLILRVICTSRDGLVYLRIDEIAYGVLLARLYVGRYWLFQHPWLAAGAGAGLSVLAIGSAWFEASPFPIALLPNLQVIGGAMLLPAALSVTAGEGRIASAVRWIASRSYALYLMHLTILSDVAETRLFETGLLSAAGCVVVAVVTPFLLADLSYRWFETPILRWRPIQPAGRLTRVPGASLGTGAAGLRVGS